MKRLGVAIESDGRIVEVVLTTEVNFYKTVSFMLMLNRWSGAEKLKARRCVVQIQEEVGVS